MGSAVLRAVGPSLVELLKYEWGLDKAVKNGLRNLEDELMSMHAFHGDVSGMPLDHLESQVKIRARQVSELSHAIKISLHSFMIRIKSTEAMGILHSAPSKLIIKHEMNTYIKETLSKVKELRDQHGTYPSKSALESTSARIGGSRMFDMDTGESNPVGLDGAIAELTKKLSKGDRVSIVGMAGMGKTALAQAVYDKIKGDFDCKAFLRFGQSADPEKVLTEIFCALHFDIYDKEPDKCQSPNIYQLHLRKFIKDKRCLIVTDNILDEGTWNLVEGIFKDSAGSKIITTTRNPKVAEEVGGIYPMEELSSDYSKELLLTKAEAKSDDTEFDIVADKIFRKCGGVPIAITLIGRFLAKNKSKGWHVAYDSIGFDEHKKDGAFEHIKKVLSSSYYDLSYNVQRCFLYLSLFPEGHLIEKNMLIWRWVAEGLIDDGSFEFGESYFNDVLDRCMIQWAVSPRDIGQGGCRLHGLMLDLIRDLSNSEIENFSTVPGMKQESTSHTIHRLAIHQDQNQNTSLEVGEVLSFYVSTCTGSFPALQKFKGLRVIDLERCDLSAGDCKLEHLGKLYGLGYIGLVGTPVAELPKKIGRLKLLQALDVTATGITKLPPFVQELVTLRCLRAGNGTSMMGQVEKLTSLEELWLHSADKSPDFAVGLRKLSKMRVLVIHFDEIDDGMQEALVESLHELKKLRVLQVWSDAGEKVRLGCWEGSVPSRQLRQMLLFGVIVPRRMPWIDRLYVPELSKLLLQVETLGAQDMKILGQMPSLGSLYLHSEDNCLSYIAGKDEFEELEYLNTNIELICGNGGLKKMQQLEVGGIWAGRDVGLQGNMPLLKRVTYHLDCQGCLPLRVEKAEEEIRKARETHPKRPDLTIRRWNNTVTEAHHIMELTKGTSPVTPRLDRPRALPSPSRGRAILRYVGNPANLNMLSEGLARLEPAIGAPPALRVGDATDATASPSQGPAFFENFLKKYLEDPEFIAFATQNEGLSSPGSASASENADASLARNGDGAAPTREPPPPEVDADNVLCWLNSPDGVALSSSMAARRGVHHDAYLMILQTCLRNPKMLATMSSAVRNGDFSDMASWLENNTVMMDLMYPDIFDYFAKQHMDRQSLLPQYADDERQADIASSSEAQGMGAPLPNKLGRPLPYWLNTPDGAACASEGAAKFGTNDVPYERVFKKCVLNPELIAAIHSAVQNDDDSEFNQLMDQLIGPEIMNYFSEQDTDEEDMDGPPKRDIAGYLLYWLNSPDGATFMSDGAAKSGINDIAYEKMCKSMLEPKFISAVGRMGDAYEFYQLLRQPVDEEFANYFEGQDIDEPSSTPGYAGGGRTTDASSTSAPPPESSGQDGEKALAAAGASSGQPSAALQVDADSVLSHGGSSNDSDMLTGLSSEQALTAQSGRMDPVASRTASVTQSREDGENSSTISNLNELPATLDKDSTDGASCGPPSSAQLDDVGNEEGDST